MSDNHDTHSPPDAAGGHDAHGAAADEPTVDTPNPTTPLAAFIWPGVIALLVLILLWGPVTGAFARFQGGYDANGQPTPTEEPATESPVPATLAATTPVTGNSATVIPQPTNVLTALPTNVQAGGTETLPAATSTVAPAVTATAPAAAPTTAGPAATSTAAPAAPATAAPATTAPTAPPAAATLTPGAAVPPPASADSTTGAPRAVSFGGKAFRVEVSTTTVPDWIFNKDPGVANWVSGTVVNYVMGVSYSAANAALFAAARPGDSIRLTRADGSVYNFTVDSVHRVAPRDTALLAQDHPALTLLLLADPAADRAVVQGHFNQAAAP